MPGPKETHKSLEMISEKIGNYPRYLIFILISLLLTGLFFTIQVRYILKLEINFYSYIIPLLSAMVFGILLAKIQIMGLRLKTHSVTDPLTGLYNRHRFHEFFENEFTLSRRYKYDLSLILLDVDNFKGINDQTGYPLGDQVLKDISRLIKLNSRLTDIASRWGGEEFMLLLPHTNISGARILSERLRLSINNFNFQGQNHVTCSFGVAEFDQEKDGMSDFIEKANNALAEAKRKGKNHIAPAEKIPGS